MAGRSMVKAQFQSGHDSLVRDVTFVQDRPVTTSEACRVLDDLQRAIEGEVRDKDVRSGAAQAVNRVKSRIRSNLHGITGRGFGQNLFPPESFTVGGRTYRVDFELSGDIKG